MTHNVHVSKCSRYLHDPHFGFNLLAEVLLRQMPYTICWRYSAVFGVHDSKAYYKWGSLYSMLRFFPLHFPFFLPVSPLSIYFSPESEDLWLGLH